MKHPGNIHVHRELILDYINDTSLTVWKWQLDVERWIAQANPNWDPDYTYCVQNEVPNWRPASQKIDVAIEVYPPIRSYIRLKAEVKTGALTSGVYINHENSSVDEVLNTNRLLEAIAKAINNIEYV